MSNMFKDCTSLTNLDIRNADFSSITGYSNYSNMLYNVPTSS